MNKIQEFAKKYTIIYCILAEVVVLGGMILAGMLMGMLLGGSGVDGYVLQALQEIIGALLAFAALNNLLIFCADV